MVHLAHFLLFSLVCGASVNNELFYSWKQGSEIRVPRGLHLVEETLIVDGSDPTGAALTAITCPAGPCVLSAFGSNSSNFAPDAAVLEIRNMRGSFRLESIQVMASGLALPSLISGSSSLTPIWFGVPPMYGIRFANCTGSRGNRTNAICNAGDTCGCKDYPNAADDDLAPASMLVKNVHVEGAWYSMLFLYQSENIDVEFFTGNHGAFTNFQARGVNYGISVHECRYVRVSLCRISAMRHAISMGGSSTRKSDHIWIVRNILTSRIIQAGDAHANTKNIVFLGNTFYGGLSLSSGDGIRVANNKILGLLPENGMPPSTSNIPLTVSAATSDSWFWSNVIVGHAIDDTNAVGRFGLATMTYSACSSNFYFEANQIFMNVMHHPHLTVPRPPCWYNYPNFSPQRLCQPNTDQWITLTAPSCPQYRSFNVSYLKTKNEARFYPEPVLCADTSKPTTTTTTAMTTTATGVETTTTAITSAPSSPPNTPLLQQPFVDIVSWRVVQLRLSFAGPISSPAKMASDLSDLVGALPKVIVALPSSSTRSSDQVDLAIYSAGVAKEISSILARNPSAVQPTVLSMRAGEYIPTSNTTPTFSSTDTFATVALALSISALALVVLALLVVVIIYRMQKGNSTARGRLRGESDSLEMK